MEELRLMWGLLKDFPAFKNSASWKYVNGVMTQMGPPSPMQVQTVTTYLKYWANRAGIKWPSGQGVITGGGWGLMDQKISGVPNLVLYAGGAILAGLGLRALKKRRK